MGEMVLPDFVALADHVVPSVVSVYSDDVQDPSERRQRMPNDPFHFFFGPQDDGAERQTPGPAIVGFRFLYQLLR